MARWTPEQQQAIDEEGTNIIVSAGAGSGKTAVLTARTLRKLKMGVHVDQLLILTFTKAAALEMMMRIRSGIIKEGNLEEELLRIDSAYITTFDSYALSIVKKYHYLLNISHDVKIVDPATIAIEKRKMLDEIFTQHYEIQDEGFLKLIGDFCIKDDREIREFVLSLNNKLDLKYDKLDYLNRYLNEHFDEKKIEDDIQLFEQLLKRRQEHVGELLRVLREEVDGDYYGKLEDVLTPLLEAEHYDQWKANIDVKLPPIPRGSEEAVKEKKEKLSAAIKEWKELLTFSSREEIYESILSTKDHVASLIQLVLELDLKLYQYKYLKDVYEFVDISKMAITIVRDHKEVREEIASSFNEIMIDEYQDTSDLQEIFISYIARDNVYMVGDIKQSIYRFRNANPYIFKSKYDHYKEQNGGIKIDLVKNFRSRDRVLDNINYLFDKIMDDAIGGAEYQESHRMVFGNQTYVNEGRTDQNYDFEVYRYDREKTSKFSKEETEIFIIAEDIQKKMREGFQIFDKDTLELRPIAYSDFVILMDRSTQFDLYKKIFESLGIPLTIYKDEKITNQNDIYLINHILKLLLGLKTKTLEEDFRYAFVGIARSYLFRMKDEEIFDVLENKNYFDVTFVRDLSSLVDLLDVLTPYEILKQIYQLYPFYERSITVGNVESSLTRLEYLLTLAQNMTELGYTIYEFSEYFQLMIQNDQMQYSLNKEESNSCKIMTIHKSKGLEFPICYYSGLYAKFNISDLKEKFTFDPTYGMIVPFFKDGIGETIYKTLLREKYLEEEISEKIRLFYVALTRAKEKMILVTPLEETDVSKDQRGVVLEDIRLKYRSFTQMLESIYEDLTEYLHEIDINKVPMSKDYLLIKQKNYQNQIPTTKEKIKEMVLKVKTKEVKEENFSKKMETLLTPKQRENIEFGKQLHTLFEIVDFQKPELDQLPITTFCKKKIEAFLKQELLSQIDQAKIYKEYEFLTLDQGKRKHGIIDLMLEYDDHIDLIDYKLQRVDDKNYHKQLKGYRDYIVNKTGKETNLYLYSILEEKLEPLK